MKSARKPAAKLIVLENSDPINAETEAIQSRVRQRAFELSQERPQDAHEIYDWIMAESEIMSVPPAELIEKDDSFELRVAVPGLDPDNINVMVTQDQILIKAEHSHGHESDSGTVHLSDSCPWLCSALMRIWSCVTITLILSGSRPGTATRNSKLSSFSISSAGGTDMISDSAIIQS